MSPLPLGSIRCIACCFSCFLFWILSVSDPYGFLPLGGCGFFPLGGSVSFVLFCAVVDFPCLRPRCHPIVSSMAEAGQRLLLRASLAFSCRRMLSSSRASHPAKFLLRRSSACEQNAQRSPVASLDGQLRGCRTAQRSEASTASSPRGYAQDNAQEKT